MTLRYTLPENQLASVNRILIQATNLSQPAKFMVLGIRNQTVQNEEGLTQMETRSLIAVVFDYYKFMFNDYVWIDVDGGTIQSF